MSDHGEEELHRDGGGRSSGSRCCAPTLQGTVRSAATGFGAFPFVTRLCDDFSPNFVQMLFHTYFGVKGALFLICNRGQNPFYRHYLKVSGADYQRYTTFARTPWAMKAAIGAVSDTFPIYGRHKTPYMFGATVLGVLAFFAVSFAPLAPGDGPDAANATSPDAANATSSGTGAIAADGAGYRLAPFLFFLIMLQIATVDLLMEGRYARMMVEKPKTGSSLVTWVWVCYFLGSLSVSAWLGPVSEHWGARAVFIMGIPFSAQILYPLWKGYMKELQVPELADKACAYEAEKVRAQKSMYWLAIKMCLGAALNAVVGLYERDVTRALIYTWTIGLSMVAMCYACVPRPLAHANFYMFLCQALYLQINGVLDSWFQGTEACVPGGPNFSDTYYFTWSGIVGSLAALAGCILFQRIFKNATFRQAFWVTTVLKVVACGVDLIMVNRWHQPYVPDKVIYILGDSIIGEIAGQLDFMPSVVLVSKLCPPGTRAWCTQCWAGFRTLAWRLLPTPASRCLTPWASTSTSTTAHLTTSDGSSSSHTWFCRC